MTRKPLQILMCNLLFAVVCGLLSAYSPKAHSQATPQKTVQISPSQVLPVNSLLWKIEGNGLKVPSYLFGTIHLICEKDVVMSKATRRALAATKQLAMEIDMANFDDGDIFSLLEKGALMRGDTTLEMLLDTASMEMVRSFFQDSLGLPLMPPMNRMKPMFLSTMLMEAGEDGCEQTSYEEEFIELAKRRKIKTLGIETVEQQLALFDFMPYKQQATMLADEVRVFMRSAGDSTASGNLSIDTLNLQTITTLYKQGKISELLDLLRNEEVRDFEEVMLNSRNRAWIPILEKMMRSKPTFIAVGAAHLPGEQGVIHLLRKQGFILTPIK